MSHLVDIQTILRPLEKMKYIFMTIFGLAETMNRPDPAVTLFDGTFLGKYSREKRKLLSESSFKS